MPPAHVDPGQIALLFVLMVLTGAVGALALKLIIWDVVLR